MTLQKIYNTNLLVQETQQSTFSERTGPLYEESKSQM